MTTDFATLICELHMSPSDFARELGLPEGQVSCLLAGEELPDRVTTWALKGYRSEKLGLDKRVLASDLKPLNVTTRPYSLDENFVGESWAAITARLSLHILIRIAAMKQHMTITYSDLHSRVVAAGGKDNIGTMTKYSKPLERIAVAFDKRKLPVLTAIVVGKGSGLPSFGVDGFVIRHLDLNRERSDALRSDLRFRRDIFEKLWREIFEYSNWPQVLQQLGLGDLQIADFTFVRHRLQVSTASSGR